MTDHDPRDQPSDDEATSLGLDALVELGDLTDDEFELVSAYVDDEVTANERLHVEHEPRLMLHVKHLRSLTGLVEAAVTRPAGAISPTTDQQRERHLAAALAAWSADDVVGSATDEPVGPSDHAPGAALPDTALPDVVLPDVARLDAARARRTRRTELVRRALTVAAALVVVAGVGGILVRLGQVDGGSSGETAATAAMSDDARSAESATDEAMKSAAMPSSAAAGGGVAGGPAVQLGTFDDLDRLVDTARQVFRGDRAPVTGALANGPSNDAATATTTPAAMTSTTAAFSSTTAGRPPLPDGGDQAEQQRTCGVDGRPTATAQLGDRPVVVVLGAGAGTIEVLDATTCAVLATRSLQP